jgi:tetratricopeptide (TPR) repeat protein
LRKRPPSRSLTPSPALSTSSVLSTSSASTSLLSVNSEGIMNQYSFVNSYYHSVSSSRTSTIYKEDPDTLIEAANERVCTLSYSLTLSSQLKLEPNNFDALYLRGCSLCKKGDFTAAINDFSVILDSNPLDTVVLFKRGNAYDKIEQLEKVSFVMHRP